MLSDGIEMTMSKIDKNELYQHLSGFLKSKGVELTAGSYSRRIEQGCGLLADAVNLSQRALTRTKTEVDKGLDRMRQAIHEKTAPKAPANQTTPEPPPGPAKAATPRSSPRKAGTARGKRSRRAGSR
jgi:hypothetical protein